MLLRNLCLENSRRFCKEKKVSTRGDLTFGVRYDQDLRFDGNGIFARVDLARAHHYTLHLVSHVSVGRLCEALLGGDNREVRYVGSLKLQTPTGWGLAR